MDVGRLGAGRSWMLGTIGDAGQLDAGRLDAGQSDWTVGCWTIGCWTPRQILAATTRQLCWPCSHHRHHRRHQLSAASLAATSLAATSLLQPRRATCLPRAPPPALPLPASPPPASPPPASLPPASLPPALPPSASHVCHSRVEGGVNSGGYMYIEQRNSGTGRKAREGVWGKISGKGEAKGDLLLMCSV